MPALRFKTCRLLLGNVWNRELTIIQRHILRRLRNKKRPIKRKIYPRQNLNKMHRRAERTSYIPFPLNPKTRSDVISVRLHFRETIPQARQPIKIRRYFYIELSVSQIIGKFLPALVWRRTKTEWFRLLKTKRGRKFGSEKVCLGSSFAEHNRMKRNLYHFQSLFLSNEKNRNRTRNPFVNNGHFYSNLTYCSGSPHQFTRKRRITKIELPTHYSEVNHKTPKAVVSYGPDIGHIPHDIRLKDPNLPLRSRNRRGQNN
ncbi:unnamed protein product [Victoria cruziana]